MWTINLPLQIRCDDQTKQVKHRPGWTPPLFTLNLNQYRNAHFRVLNPAKVNFEILARGLIRRQKIPKLNQVSLEYVFFPGSRQRRDTNNVCSIVDKFFSDALVSAGIIEDDNYNFIVDSRFRFGQIDKLNPRVTVTIRNSQEAPFLEHKKEPMKIQSVVTTKIILTRDDLTQAIREYLTKHTGLTAASELSVSPETFTTLMATGEVELSISQVQDLASAKPGRKARLEPSVAMSNLSQTLREKQESEGTSGSGQESSSSEEQAPGSGETASEIPDASTGSGEPSSEEAPPPPAKGPSLFDKFKRPSNG